jgi:hypothetical protein
MMGCAVRETTSINADHFKEPTALPVMVCFNSFITLHYL